MKTALLPSCLLAAATAAASTAPQNVRQDVTRLTLLPGPHLTSPAKGAPQPTPVVPLTEGMVRIGAEPQFRFVPARPAAPATGTLELRGDEERNREFAPARRPTSPPAADTLRFDAQLPRTGERPLLERSTPPPAAPAR